MAWRRQKDTFDVISTSVAVVHRNQLLAEVKRLEAVAFRVAEVRDESARTSRKLPYCDKRLAEGRLMGEGDQALMILG